jgi:hypothetical protein
VELLEAQVHSPPHPPVTRVPALTETDERAARRSLRGQIARLERDLAAALVTAYPHPEPERGVAGRGGPRLLGLGELERLRDELAQRVLAARARMRQRAEFEDHNRLLLERMLAHPAGHKYVRIATADVGMPGCGHYHVRPRLGIVGMLMGWWQVKLSSGCPLARGPR